MSPEQLSGERELDRRTDVYSLGGHALRVPDVPAARRGRHPRVAAQGHPRGRPRGRRASFNRALPARSRDRARVRARRRPRSPLRRRRSRSPRTCGGSASTSRSSRGPPAGGSSRAGGRSGIRPPSRAASRRSRCSSRASSSRSLLLARVTREQAQTRREQSKLIALRQAYLAQIVGEREARARAPARNRSRAPRAPPRDRQHPLRPARPLLREDDLRDRRALELGRRSGTSRSSTREDRLIVGYAGGIAAFDLATSAPDRSGRQSGDGTGARTGPRTSRRPRTAGSSRRLTRAATVRLWTSARRRALRETRADGPDGADVDRVLARRAPRSRRRRGTASVAIHDGRARRSRASRSRCRSDPSPARAGVRRATLVAVCGLLRARQPDGARSAAVVRLEVGQGSRAARASGRLGDLGGVVGRRLAARRRLRRDGQGVPRLRLDGGGEPRPRRPGLLGGVPSATTSKLSREAPTASASGTPRRSRASPPRATSGSAR